jgi:O-antigen/teichoic acid export membrane protein
MKGIFYKIGYNTFIQIIGKIIISSLGFLTIGILTRYLGQEGFGNFNLVFAYLSFFGIFGDLGLQVSMVRELAKNSLPEKIYGSYFWLKLFLITISMILAIVVLIFFPYSPLLKMAIIMGALAYSLGLLNNYGVVIFQANLRLDYVAAAEVVVKIVTTILILLFVYLKVGLVNLLATVFLGNLIGSVLIILLLKKLIKLNFIFDLDLAKKLFFRSLPIGLISLLSIFYFKIDTLLLAYFKGAGPVGIYSLAYGLIENILVLWGYYIASYYPLYSKFVRQIAIKQAASLFKNSYIICLVCSLVILVIGYLAAPVIINILGGSEFKESSSVLRILLFSIPFFFLNNLFYHTMLAKNKENIPLIGVGFSLVISIIINLIFIPRYSFLGACLSVIAAQSFLAIFYIFNLN